MTKTPLTKYYRYGDYFQVLPMDIAHAPKNKNARLFPTILEYWYEDTEVKKVNVFDSDGANEMVAMLSATTGKILEITNFLSAITNHRFIYNQSPRLGWAVQFPEENNEEVNNQSSFWSMGMYYYPKMGDDLKITEFSKPKVAFVDLIPRQQYYYYDPVESHKKEITFPDSFDNTVAKYLKLTEKEKIVCDSSIYQLCNSLDLDNHMKSLSFLSAVSSIETLVNYEFRNEKIEFECNDCKTVKSSNRQCAKCGRPIWGVAAKFREFLFKYVSSDPKAKKFYNEIYNIRSKIAHTEYLINNENYMNWDFLDKTDEELNKYIEAIQLCRRSISSWLINKA